MEQESCIGSLNIDTFLLHIADVWKVPSYNRKQILVTKDTNHTLCEGLTMHSQGHSNSGIINTHRPDLKPFEALYRHLHANPELSGQESETASTIVKNLRLIVSPEDIITSTDHHGVVAILRNGPGPTVLLRAELDALPIREETSLPYASTKTMLDSDSTEQPVSHACGHDMHATCLLAALSLLSSAHTHWTGTLIALFQPAEETFHGARAMLSAGLYRHIPLPTILLAQHTVTAKTGTLGLRAGPVLTACATFRVTVHGRGGHGSSPEKCADPVLTAAQAVVRLQGVVSREVSPREFAVVSVGALQAGSLSAPGVVPEKAEFVVDVRAYNMGVLERVERAVRRIVEGECVVGGMGRGPGIERVRSAPATVNGEVTTRALREAFEGFFGGDVFEAEQDTASEDFGLLAEGHGIPYVYWQLGSTEVEKWDAAKREGRLDGIPDNHSPYFCPDLEPTLRTGTDAMALAALTFLGRPG